MTGKNSSLQVQVYQKIRDDILGGVYHAGEELTEVTLGQSLGVSRTPVREALRQLALEGLIDLVPNRGAFVKGISWEDIQEIYEIRARLEGLCAAKAARNATEEEMEQMEETMVLAEFHARKQHMDQVFELDSRFHERMYQASHSRMLSHTLSQYHQYVMMVRKASIATRLRFKNTNKEHEAILQAVRNRDPEEAERLAKQHILNSMENIRKLDIQHLLKGQEDKRDGKN